MCSFGFHVKLIVAVFSGFVIYVASHDDKKLCFDVGAKNICYFHPRVSTVDWDTAWKTCRELNSTLPVITDKKVQAVFKTYLDNSYAIFPVWTAGRYTGDSEWKWINGLPFQGKDKPPCAPGSASCYHETQAVIIHQLKYEAKYPFEVSPYLCRFTGASCTSGSNDSIRWEDGCIEWDKNDRKSLNEARNKCLERDGDLATFSGQDDLQRLQPLLPSHMFTDANRPTKYWIGLHRKWWIWNATDVQDIRYNLLKTDLNYNPVCLFITDGYEWGQDYCPKTKYVICQTVSYRPTEESPSMMSTNVIIGLVVGVLVVAIIIVGLLILYKKRRQVAHIPDAGTSVSKSYTVPPTRNTDIHCQDDTYASIDDDLGNPKYVNDPKSTALSTKGKFSDDPSGVYSEPTDFGASVTNRSTASSSEDYINTAGTSVPRNPAGSPSSAIYAVVNKPGHQKKESDELISPPMKIGPQGDIYALPIS